MKGLLLSISLLFNLMSAGYSQNNRICANDYIAQGKTLENAIILAFKKGDDVYIKSGSYNLDSTIDILPNKHLMGEGNVTLNFGSKVYYGIGLATGSTLENITIDGGNNLVVGVISGNAKNVVVDKCTVKNCQARGALSAYGIFIKNGTSATVTNNTIVNILSSDPKAANRGIAIGNTQGTTKITNNSVTNVTGPANADGIGVNDNGLSGSAISSSTTLISNNKIHNAWNRGIKIQANGIKCTITNNVITSDRPYDGNIYMVAGMGIQSSNNDIRNNIIRVKFACHGIAVTQKVNNNTITGNYIAIDSTGQADDRVLNLRRKTGIFIDAAASNTIQDNTIVGPTYGVRIVSSQGLPSNNTIIERNNFRRVRYGISDVTKTPYMNNTVSDNRFDDVDSVAINVSRYMQGRVQTNQFKNVRQQSMLRN